MLALWAPPPKLKISDWADNFRQIPREASSEPGSWNTNRAPYQREMMNASCSALTERVVMMTAAQIGKTEILLNTLGYYVDKEPSPILMINPTKEMSEVFSRDRLAPMIRDTPCLACKIADTKSRTSGNTLSHKAFPGGQIELVGANSPAGLASRPIRILLCDEVDRYPQSAGTEGDPLNLAMKRTQNFWNRKIILVSTPTLKGVSRIEKAYENSSREEFLIPCPECKSLQAITWSNIEYKNHSEPILKCEHCGKNFSRREWLKNMTAGQWHAENPESKIRGFHINAFYSPWASWESLCESFEEAKNIGEDAVKVWHNTVLGLPYEFTSWAVEVSELEDSAENYEAELPDGVLCLTAGVDVQDNRLEIEIVGWGLRYESWGIEYKVIYGSPGAPDVWNELDEYLSRTWKFLDGSELGLSCVCIDSAGHFTDEVYKFVKPRKERRIFAIVGRGMFGMPHVSKPSYNNRYRVALFTLGVTTLKSLLFSRLNAKPGEAGYCHFPAGERRGYSRKYFDGLMSENMKLERKNGQNKVVWEKRSKHARNEPLDCRVYAMGALSIYNPDMKRLSLKKDRANMQVKEPLKKLMPVKKAMLKRGLRL